MENLKNDCATAKTYRNYYGTAVTVHIEISAEWIHDEQVGLRQGIVHVVQFGDGTAIVLKDYSNRENCTAAK